MKSKKIGKTLVYIVSIAAALAAGGISSVFAMSAMEEYGALKQPPLAPPPWLFPAVWTILFVLMGISAARIYIIGKPDRSGKKFGAETIRISAGRRRVRSAFTSFSSF